MTHDDRPVFTAHDIPDLFNSMPTLFGFRPVESIVAIATSGPRRRMGFRLRMDLPDAEHVDDAASVIVGHLRRQGAEGVIALAITRRQDVAHDLLDAIEAELAVGLDHSNTTLTANVTKCMANLAEHPLGRKQLHAAALGDLIALAETSEELMTKNVAIAVQKVTWKP